MANTTGAQPVGGGSRLLGVNQLQTSIDNLTGAIQSLISKMGGNGPAGSGASFTNAPGLNQAAAGGNGSSAGAGAIGLGAMMNQMGGGNAGSPTMGNAAPTLNATASPGNGGQGGMLSGASVGGAIGGGMSMLQNFGSGQMGNMTALSSYLQMGSLYGGNQQGMMGNITRLNDIASTPTTSRIGPGNARVRVRRLGHQQRP